MLVCADLSVYFLPSIERLEAECAASILLYYMRVLFDHEFQLLCSRCHESLVGQWRTHLSLSYVFLMKLRVSI